MIETLELLADADFGHIELTVEAPSDLPKGTIAKVNFPTLMKLGIATPDGRWFDPAGFSVEPLPLPISYKDTTTSQPGHEGARIAGSLRHVETSTDGIVSGWGYLIDNPAGHECKLALETGSIRGTSADLRECALASASVMDSLGVRAAYGRGKLAQVTIVPIPAFADAQAVLDEGLVASATLMHTLRPPRDAFDNPRLSKPTGIRVVPLTSEFNQVFGHLATWSNPHIGHRKVIPPPRDDDFSYFYSGGTVLCDDETFVHVGRVFLGAGHPSTKLPAQEALDRYTATCAAWADVRVGKDAHGIWFAGVTRPGVNEELMYEARASAVSGDWRPIKGRRRLIAVLSSNTAGFPILEPGVALENEDDCALIASVPAPVEDVDEAETEDAVIIEEEEEEDTPVEETPAPRPALRVIRGGILDPVAVRRDPA